MEILEPNRKTVANIVPDWDAWLVLDQRPKIIERGVDFTSDVSTIKRKLMTEAAGRGYDITAKVLVGDRLLFQVFTPNGEYPELPSLPDARKKYPWSKWFDGASWRLEPEDFEMDQRSMRAYIYKMATQRNLKASVSLLEGGGLILSAHPPEELAEHISPIDETEN